MQRRSLKCHVRGRRSAVLVVVIGGLALAGPALAAKQAAKTEGAPKTEGAAKTIAGAKIVSHYWEMTVGGHTYAVKAGGQINYPECDTVETITPIVKVKVKGSGEHVYRAVLEGPKTAGSAGGKERAFNGPSAVIEAQFIASEFPKLAENTNAPHFLPGEYSIQLTIGKTSEALAKTGKPKVVEKIKVVARKGC